MTVLKWVWLILGAVVTLQYLYWAVLELASWLNLHEPPVIANGWLFLAFFGAALFSGEKVLESFGQLSKGSNYFGKGARLNG